METLFGTAKKQRDKYYLLLWVTTRTPSTKKCIRTPVVVPTPKASVFPFNFIVYIRTFCTELMHRTHVEKLGHPMETYLSHSSKNYFRAGIYTTKPRAKHSSRLVERNAKDYFASAYEWYYVESSERVTHSDSASADSNIILQRVL